MKQSSLGAAEHLLKCRKFNLAREILESCFDSYKDDFDYYVVTGICMLYLGLFGEARYYFNHARHIKINDSRLLLGQAAIFLHQENISSALEYYLEVLQLDSLNKTANHAIDFINSLGGNTTLLHKYIDSGEIQRFYPPLGVNPHIIRNCILAGIFTGLLAAGLWLYIPGFTQKQKIRKDLQFLELTKDERKYPQAAELGGRSINYVLDSKQLRSSSDLYLKYMAEGRDNAAKVEINRILNSNAALSVLQKARMALDLIKKAENPTFDTVSDIPSYMEVINHPELYQDCCVIWKGRVSRPLIHQGEGYDTFIYDFLVGYDDSLIVEGIVPVTFYFDPKVDPEKPVEFLARVQLQDKKISLLGISSYQKIAKK